MHGSLLFCLLSGAVFSLPYRVEWLFPLTYVALSTFLFLLRGEQTRRRRFWACFLFMLGFLTPLYTWFSALYPLSALGISRLSAFGIVLLGCLAVPAIQSATQALLLHGEVLLPRERPVLHALGMASLWVLAESLHAFGELALPWGTVALSQTGFYPLLQTASLLGSGWITFFTVLLCDLTADALYTKRYRRLTRPGALLLAVCLVGVVLPLLPREGGQPIRVAAIQGNISTDEKWEGERMQEVYTTYRALTEEAAQNGAELILLPESAIPVYFKDGGVLEETFSGIAKQYGSTILSGVLRKEADGVHNSMVAILPDGRHTAYYDKQHPVPFGEFVPLNGLFGGTLSSLNLNETLTVADTPRCLQVGDTRVGCFLCFDSVFSGARQASEGAELLVIGTNDAWFGNSSGIRQHLRFAKLRAAESGKMLLRAGNTGISAILDADGQILAQTEAETKGILYGEVTPYAGKSLFGITGDLFGWLSGLLLSGILLSGSRKKVKKTGSNE